MVAIKGTKVGAIAWIGLLLGLMALVIFFVHQLLNSVGALDTLGNSDRMRSWIVQLGYLGPLTLIAMMALAIVVNPIPSAPIALAAGAAYGHVWGTFYVVTGATLGAFIAFSIARRLGYAHMLRLFGPRLQLGWLGSQNALTGMLFASRLIPFVSFDLVSYGAGLTDIKSWRFVLATVAGLLPASFLLAHFGGELTASSLDRATFAVLMLGLLSLLPLLVRAGVRRIRQRRRLPADQASLSDQ